MPVTTDMYAFSNRVTQDFYKKNMVVVDENIVIPNRSDNRN